MYLFESLDKWECGHVIYINFLKNEADAFACTVQYVSVYS